jgi:hypothetical protein
VIRIVSDSQMECFVQLPASRGGNPLTDSLEYIARFVCTPPWTQQRHCLTATAAMAHLSTHLYRAVSVNGPVINSRL